MKDKKGISMITIVLICAIIVIIVGVVIVVTTSGKNKEGNVSENLVSNDNTSVSENTSKDNEEKEEETKSIFWWNPCEISIKGKTVVLPCSFKEFSEATGLFLDPKDKEEYHDCTKNLSKGVDVYEKGYSQRDEDSATITVFNNTDKQSAPYEECLVIGIYQSTYHLDSSVNSEVTFPKGLKVGETMTSEQLKSLLGDFDIVNHNSNSRHVEFLYRQGKEKNAPYARVELSEDDKIESISISVGYSESN